jgi:hypothetical protein
MRALSGGLVYEYSAEEAGYGLVTIEQDGSVKLMQDYDNLQDQFNKLDIKALESASPQATDIKAPECSDSLITASQFSKNFTIPAVCPGCQDLIDNGIENPQNGKLVNVDETNVQQNVYGSGGQQIQGLKLNMISDGSNTPGGENTSPSSTGGDNNNNRPSQTGDGARPTETGEGAALHLGSSSMLALVSFIVCAICL